MPLRVRRGAAEDVEQMIEMQINMARETEQLTLDEETLRKGITRVIENTSLGNYYVVEDTDSNDNVENANINHDISDTSAYKTTDNHRCETRNSNRECNNNENRKVYPIVGMLLTTYEWSDWRNGCTLWIQSAYVVPSYRRRGVFTAMFTYLHEMVKKSDFYVGLRLYVEHNNNNAKRTYEKLGMTTEHYNMMKWMKTDY